MSSQPPSAAPLDVRHGDRTFTVQPGDVLTIGRARECTIVLDDARVSRKHAWLQHDAGGWTLYSQGGNGTFVGGRRVEEHRVTAPVTFHVGDADGVPIQVRPAGAPSGQAPAPQQPGYPQAGPVDRTSYHPQQPGREVGPLPPSGPMPVRGPGGAPQGGPVGLTYHWPPPPRSTP